MFVTPAYAQAGAAASGGADMLISLAPFVFILVIMYVLIIRPQRQQMKRHQEMVANMRRGDTVVLSGGIIGKISKTMDAEVEVEIAPGVKVTVVRSTISEVRAKGEPAKETAAKAKE